MSNLTKPVVSVNNDDDDLLPGAIGDAIRAGFPPNLLIPICPWNYQQWGPRNAGKRPARWAGAMWAGLSAWESGVEVQELVGADRQGANCGLRCGVPSGGRQYAVIDVDLECVSHVAEMMAHLVPRLGGDACLIRATRAGRAAILVGISSLIPGHHQAIELTHQQDGPAGKLEVLTTGQQCVIGGTHQSGNRITWFRAGEPKRKSTAPPINEGVFEVDDFDALIELVIEALRAAKADGFFEWRRTSGGNGGEGVPTGHAVPPGLEVRHLLQLLEELPNPASCDYTTWLNIMMAVDGTMQGLEAANGPLDESAHTAIAFAVADHATRWEAPKGVCTHEEGLGKWEGSIRGQSRDLGWDALCRFANQLGAGCTVFAIELDMAGIELEERPADQTEPDAAAEGKEEKPRSSDRAPAFSEELIALAFAEKHSAQLQYVDTWGQWLVWDGKVWTKDETRLALCLARPLCREQARKADTQKLARQLAGVSTMSAVIRLACTDRRIAATSSEWDQDIWALNTPDGVVDLKTGKLYPHLPDARMTKTTKVGPGGDCPTWIRFLDQVTGGDRELQGYLKRFAGYSLTGDTSEHALAFLWGPGGNGKGTFLNPLRALMGDYAAVAPMDAFTATTGQRHPTDMAMLRGARLVVAQETAEGSHWDEQRVTALTGGDRISARFMRQDFFEYDPQFKLIFAGNHKPQIRNANEAIRRRLNLIPFEFRVPEKQKDKKLGDKLKAEWGGILQWMVEGCLEWQQVGLQPPDRVRVATEDYLQAEDCISQWVSEKCETGKDMWALSSDLFASWKFWAEAVGEPVRSQKRFSQALMARGFRNDDTTRGPNGQSGFAGVRPRNSLAADKAEAEGIVAEDKPSPDVIH